MSDFDPDRTAAAIAELRANRRLLEPLASGLAPETAEQGAAAQVALARLTAAMPPAGFKIGATAPRMQAYLGLTGPVAGFMPAPGLHRSGVRLAYADFVRPGVECEVLVRLAHDLPARACTVEQARAAVGALFAGIEIVENRYGADPAVIGVPTLMVDQVYHAACVMGEATEDWQGLDIPTLGGRMRVDGRIVGEGHAGDLMGDPFNCLAWLAGSVEVAAFGGLRAGQIVMLGSVTPPVWLDGPCAVDVTFDRLSSVTLTLI